jgi:hypothetical protein
MSVAALGRSVIRASALVYVASEGPGNTAMAPEPGNAAMAPEPGNAAMAPEGPGVVATGGVPAEAGTKPVDGLAFSNMHPEGVQELLALRSAEPSRLTVSGTVLPGKSENAPFERAILLIFFPASETGVKPAAGHLRRVARCPSALSRRPPLVVVNRRPECQRPPRRMAEPSCGVKAHALTDLYDCVRGVPAATADAGGAALNPSRERKRPGYADRAHVPCERSGVSPCSTRPPSGLTPPTDDFYRALDLLSGWR